MSLLTKIDPIKACSASKFEGFLSGKLFCMDIFFSLFNNKLLRLVIKRKVTHSFFKLWKII